MDFTQKWQWSVILFIYYHLFVDSLRYWLLFDSIICKFLTFYFNYNSEKKFNNHNALKNSIIAIWDWDYSDSNKVRIHIGEVKSLLLSNLIFIHFSLSFRKSFQLFHSSSIYHVVRVFPTSQLKGIGFGIISYWTLERLSLLMFQLTWHKKDMLSSTILNIVLVLFDHISLMWVFHTDNN